MGGFEADLSARFGYKDLVSLHRTRRGVVTSMTDPPAVVRDEESRVEDPADGVVDGLAR